MLLHIENIIYIHNLPTYYIIKPYHITGFNRIMAIYVKHYKIDECFVYIPILYLSVEHEFSEQK